MLSAVAQIFQGNGKKYLTFFLSNYFRCDTI